MQLRYMSRFYLILSWFSICFKCYNDKGIRDEMTMRRKGKNAVLSKRNVPNHDIYALCQNSSFSTLSAMLHLLILLCGVDGSEGWWGSRSKEPQYFTKIYSFVWNMRSLTQGNNKLTFITTALFSTLFDGI